MVHVNVVVTRTIEVEFDLEGDTHAFRLDQEGDIALPSYIKPESIPVLIEALTAFQKEINAHGAS